MAFYNDKGLNGDEFTFGLGTHDDPTLIQISDDKNKLIEQSPVLSKNMDIALTSLLESKTRFRAAKFGEIFTTKNNFFTVFDAFGIDKRINTQNNKDKGNWGARLPVNYEETYHQNVSRGRGLNLPQAYLFALKAKGSNDGALLDSLKKAAKVLGSDSGVYTQAQADEKLGASFTEIG